MAKVISSAAFIAGQVVEGRGWAALASKVPRPSAVPAAQSILTHDRVLIILIGIMILDGRETVRGDIDSLGSTIARCRHGRLIGEAGRWGGELLFCRGVFHNRRRLGLFDRIQRRSRRLQG